MSRTKVLGIIIGFLMIFTGFFLLIFIPTTQFGYISLFLGFSLSILISNSLIKDLKNSQKDEFLCATKFSQGIFRIQILNP